VLLPRGGIPPFARRRSRLALRLAEREDISRGIASGSSIREIASRLERAVSTVSREVTRHGGRPAYRAHDADRQAWVSALRPKRCLITGNRKLRNIVASKLILNWSPEQISGWLKIQFPDDASMRVSHETIYRSLFIQARGVLKKKRSLTWGRGLEMAKHKDFTVATDVQVYFCDPQSPWQRGTNENTNLLLRQYFPRGTDLSGYSQEQLDQVSLLLNQRPRKTLGFHTSADKLQASVVSTA
jgi:IS30 family transposase